MKKTYIGIDLGHGETAAACPQENAQGEYSVVRLNTAEGNMQVIPTQIILTNEQMTQMKGKKQLDYEFLKSIGPFRIGDCPAYVPNGERFFYFKVAPKEFRVPCGVTPTAKSCGITHGMVMACYAYALVENIFFYNPDVLLENKRFEAELLVGCPTTQDWTDPAAQEAYAKLVKQATGVNMVDIIPESRAAMFSSVENNVNTISAEKGAVVFDFGSSTADCTYMLLGRKILEFSWTLGAFKVERAMTREALRLAMEEDGLFDPDDDKLMEVADSLRGAKEAYYNGMYPPKGKTIICEFQEANSDEIRESPIRISQTFMDRVTGVCETDILCDSTETRVGSWRNLCRAFFTEAKKRIEASTYKDEKGNERHCTVDTVVITGGASKMDFIKPMCESVYTGCKVLLNESNPSHTVSNGLCWIAITDSNLPSCRSDALKQVQNSGATNQLVSQLSSAIFAYIKDVTVYEANEWAEQDGDTATIADLEQRLKEAMNRKTVMDRIKKICDRVIVNWKGSLGTELEKAINAQMKKLYSAKVARSLVLPEDVWKELDSNMVGMQLDTDKLLKSINIENYVHSLTGAIVKLAIWVVAAILAIETFGISLLAAWIFTSMDVSDKDMNKARTRDQRRSICSRIGEEMDKKQQEVMKDFEENMRKQTKNLDGAVGSMLDAALAVVTLRQFSL